MYWACASTGLTNKAWRGQEYYINGNITGGHTDTHTHQVNKSRRKQNSMCFMVFAQRFVF